MTRSIGATVNDAHLGRPVVVTCSRQSNGSLHAMIVDIFPEPVLPPDPGQQPANAGRLAMSGTVDHVSANELIVRYPDGAAPISLGADTRRTMIVTAARDKLPPGVVVSVLLQGSQAHVIVLRGPDTLPGFTV